jgi:hypothetical protein
MEITKLETPAALRRPAAIILAIAMLASAMLHLYWVMGGTWFLATALNMEVEQLPDNLVALTWILALGMVAAALIAVCRARLIKTRLPQWLFAAALWVFAFLMFAGAVFNALIPRFWDRWVFAPIFLLLAILSLIVALPAREEPV